MAISTDFIAKIEGHGRLLVNWEKNKVKLEVAEGERLFEGLLVGRPATDAFWITPRICGVCPIAHNMAALRAVEAVWKIDVSDSAAALRKLMLFAQIIQSHILHLYFLALPDYVGLDSGLELANTQPKYFASALKLKKVSDEIAHVVGGRAIHPTTTTIGGFHKVPKLAALKKLKNTLKDCEESAESTVNLFSSLAYPKIKIDLVLFSQVDDQTYNIYDGEFIKSNKKLKEKVEDYVTVIKEEVKEYSTAKFGYYQGKGMMVGALARLAIQGQFASNETKQFIKKSRLDFKNPFHNNLAQAIEVYLFTKEALELLDEILEKGIDEEACDVEKFAKIKRKGQGVGAIEAPRGGLYYDFTIDADGKIEEANIITPTVQNLSSIEESAQQVLNQTKKLTREERTKLMEMLVRAYDPCITCSVH